MDHHPHIHPPHYSLRSSANRSSSNPSPSRLARPSSRCSNDLGLDNHQSSMHFAVAEQAIDSKRQTYPMAYEPYSQAEVSTAVEQQLLYEEEQRKGLRQAQMLHLQQQYQHQQHPLLHVQHYHEQQQQHPLYSAVAHRQQAFAPQDSVFCSLSKLPPSSPSAPGSVSFPAHDQPAAAAVHVPGSYLGYATPASAAAAAQTAAYVHYAYPTYAGQHDAQHASAGSAYTWTRKPPLYVPNSGCSLSSTSATSPARHSSPPPASAAVCPTRTSNKRMTRAAHAAAAAAACRPMVPMPDHDDELSAAGGESWSNASVAGSSRGNSPATRVSSSVSVDSVVRAGSEASETPMMLGSEHGHWSSVGEYPHASGVHMVETSKDKQPTFQTAMHTVRNEVNEDTISMALSMHAPVGFQVQQQHDASHAQAGADKRRQPGFPRVIQFDMPILAAPASSNGSPASKPLGVSHASTLVDNRSAISYIFSSPAFGRLLDPPAASAIDQPIVANNSSPPPVSANQPPIIHSSATHPFSIPPSASRAAAYPRRTRISPVDPLDYTGYMFPTRPCDLAPPGTAHHHQHPPPTRGQNNHNNYLCIKCTSYTLEFAHYWQPTIHNLILLHGFMCPPCARKLRGMPIVRGMSGDGASGESVIDRYYRGKDVRGEAVVPGLFECVYRWATAVVVSEPRRVREEEQAGVIAAAASGRAGVTVGGAAVPTRCSSVPVAGAPDQRDEGYFGMTDDELSGASSKPATPRGSLLDALDLGLATVPDADMSLLAAIGLTPRSLLLAGPKTSEPAPTPAPMRVDHAEGPSKRKRPKRNASVPCSAMSDELAQSLAPSIRAAAVDVLGGPLVAPDVSSPTPKRAPAPVVFPYAPRLLPVTHQVYPAIAELGCASVSRKMVGDDEVDEIWHVGAPMVFAAATVGSYGGEQPAFEFPRGSMALPRRENKQKPLVTAHTYVKATIRGGVRKYRRQRAHWTDSLSNVSVAKSLVVGLAAQASDESEPSSPGVIDSRMTVARKVEHQHAEKPARKKRKDAGTKRGPKKRPDLTIKVPSLAELEASTSLPTPLSPTSLFARAQSIVSASSASTSASASRASTPIPTSPADSRDTIWARMTKESKRWCFVCGTNYTTQWRAGPWGKKTVCNKHGLALKGKHPGSTPRLDLSAWAHESKEDRTEPLYHLVCFTCHEDNVPHAEAQLEGELLHCGGCARAIHGGNEKCMRKVSHQQYAHVHNDTKSAQVDANEAADPVWFCSNACVDGFSKCMKGKPFTIDDWSLNKNPLQHMSPTPPTLAPTPVLTLPSPETTVPPNLPAARKRRRNPTQSDGSE